MARPPRRPGAERAKRSPPQTGADPAGVVEEGREELVVGPHVRGLETQLDLGGARHAEAHDLVEIVAGGLGGWERVGVEDRDVGGRVAGPEEVQGRRRADRATAAHDDDLGGGAGAGHSGAPMLAVRRGVCGERVAEKEESRVPC